MVLCFALLPVTAAAWDSPQQAVSEFLAYELGGGRLHSDEDAYARYMHAAPDHDGIGFDTVLLSDAHSVGKLRCKADRCEVTVHFQLPGVPEQDDFPLANKKRASSRSVSYSVLNRDGDWRIDADSLQQMPVISPATMAAHKASVLDGMDEELEERHDSR